MNAFLEGDLSIPRLKVNLVQHKGLYVDSWGLTAQSSHFYAQNHMWLELIGESCDAAESTARPMCGGSIFVLGRVGLTTTSIRYLSFCSIVDRLSSLPKHYGKLLPCIKSCCKFPHIHSSLLILQILPKKTTPPSYNHSCIQAQSTLPS
jgi:hypothetical protein